MTKREAHLKSHNEQKCESSDDDSQYPQEYKSSTESGNNTEYAQESPKRKSHKKTFKVKIVKSKEYKIPQQKMLSI